MTAPAFDKKVDVNALFGLSRPTVQGLVGSAIQSNLSLLQTLETGRQPSPFSAEDTEHFRGVMDAYLRDHPLGFLAKSSPVIAQGMMQDALRRDVIRLMGVYNFANGNFKDTDAPITELRSKGTDEFAPAVQEIFDKVHRNVIVRSAEDMGHMVQAMDEGLWGTSARSEKELKTQFKDSARQLDRALALFDRGEVDVALEAYANTMGDAEGYVSWFGRAVRQSEQQKFAAHVGIAIAAGAAAYFTGGATLALLGGKEATLGAHVTSMIAGGAGMTAASRGLNAVLFHKPVFANGNAMEKAVDLGGEVLHNAALMGVLRLGNIAGASLPMMEGEPVIAASVNAIRNFAVELGSFTGFNMISSASHLIDPNYASIDDVLSRKALVENAAFVLGLRIGHLGLETAKATAKRTMRTIASVRDTFHNALYSPRFAQFLLSPLVIIGGIPGGGTPKGRRTKTGIPPPPQQPVAATIATEKSPGDIITDTFASLITLLGNKPTVIDLYQRRLYKFWAILSLLKMGIPEKLVAYRILKLQPDARTQDLLKEFRPLLNDEQVKGSLTAIQEKGLVAFLAESGFDIRSDENSTGVDKMARTIAAYPWMLDIIERYGPAAKNARHTVGMELEGRTHFRLSEEVVWPDEEPVAPPAGPNEPTARDRLALLLRDKLAKVGHTVELVDGRPYFGFSPSPILFPTIFERFKTEGQTVKVEILAGTGAVIVSVKFVDFTNSTKIKQRTEHVKGARSVFDPAVDDKVAELVTWALHLNITDENPRDVLQTLRRREGYSRRYLMLAKATDNDILKTWVTFNPDETATLTPLNGIISDENGDYATGRSVTIPAKEYQDVYLWFAKRTAGNPFFARKLDKYDGVRIKDFGVVTMTDEAHPFKEVVSPILTPEKFATWLDVVSALSDIGITGTTPNDLVGKHIHGNLPTSLETGETQKFTILPVLGVLRGFLADMQMFYDAIPSHPNRMGFIQRLPLWFEERLRDPNYVTDPTDRRQILRVAADLARDVKKYNAMNVSNHISALLAKMIEAGLYRDGEDLTDHYKGEDYRFYVTLGAMPETHDIVREVDCATYSFDTHPEGGIRRTVKKVGASHAGKPTADFFDKTLFGFIEDNTMTMLPKEAGFQKPVQFQGDDFLFKVKKSTEGAVSVEVTQQVHLIRVAIDARKTTAELRIFDVLFDRETAEFFLKFYHAWSWWYGTGQYLNQPQAPSTPKVVEGGLKAMGIGVGGLPAAEDAPKAATVPPRAPSDSVELILPPQID